MNCFKKLKICEYSKNNLAKVRMKNERAVEKTAFCVSLKIIIDMLKCGLKR